MKRIEQKYITSSDLSLVAALALYFPIEKVQKCASRRILFYFKKTPNTKTIVDKYWNDSLHVSVLGYASQLRTIKSLIHQQWRNHEE